jgi:CHASE2 domain-containing sensor protein
MAVNWLDSWLKNKWVHHGLRLAFALLITVLLFPFQFYLVEYTSYDWRMKLSPRPGASGQIVLLSVDQNTLRKLKRDPEALDWAVVLQKIAQAGPSEVVTFINPTQIQGSYDDLAMLADIMGRMPIYFGEDDLPKTGAPRMEALAAPFDNIPVESSPKTSDTKVLAKDGVTRRAILSYEGRPLLFPRLAQKYNGIDKVENYSGAFQFLASVQLNIRYRKKGAYPTLKFADVLEGAVNPADVRDKIVLIGQDTLENPADYLTTPMSKELLALTKLEMYANALDTLIMNEAPRFSPQWVKVIFTFLISLLTIYIVLYVRPGKGLVLLGLTLTFTCCFHYPCSPASAGWFPWCTRWWPCSSVITS